MSIYPGTCRDLTPEQIAEKRKKKAPAYRLSVPDEEITFADGCMGPHTENLLRDCGDFYLRRADGVFAYQLAVVVDDARMGVTGGGAGRGPALLHGPAAVSVPSAGPARHRVCPLPAAAGPGWPPPLQAGRGPEPGKSAGKIHGAGDHRQACLRLRPAAGAGPPHAGKPDRGVFAGQRCPKQDLCLPEGLF